MPPIPALQERKDIKQKAKKKKQRRLRARDLLDPVDGVVVQAFGEHGCRIEEAELGSFLIGEKLRSLVSANCCCRREEGGGEELCGVKLTDVVQRLV